jgi:hypothetical protein
MVKELRIDLMLGQSKLDSLIIYSERGKNFQSPQNQMGLFGLNDPIVDPTTELSAVIVTFGEP